MRKIFNRVLSAVLAASMFFGSAPTVFAESIRGIQLFPNRFTERKYSPNVWKDVSSERAVLLKSPELFSQVEGIDGKVIPLTYGKYSRTYLTEKGGYATQISLTPITYEDENGDEKLIDNTLIRSGDGYRNAANSFDVYLPETGGAVSIDSGGKKLEISPLFGSLANSVVSENAIRYNGVAPGIDLEYIVGVGGLKENIILNHPVAEPIFRYELASEGVYFRIYDGVVYAFSGEPRSRSESESEGGTESEEEPESEGESEFEDGTESEDAAESEDEFEEEVESEGEPGSGDEPESGGELESGSETEPWDEPESGGESESEEEAESGSKPESESESKASDNYLLSEMPTDYIFSLSAPYMSDADGNISFETELRLEIENGKNILYVIADEGWLSAPERVYPVKIDPSMTIYLGMIFGFLEKDSGGRNCSQNAFLYVGEASATLVGFNGIYYDDTISYIKFDDSEIASIAALIAAECPEGAVITASLKAYKYAGQPPSSTFVAVKTITGGSPSISAMTRYNMPGRVMTDSGQDVSGGPAMITWDISTAFSSWFDDIGTNFGLTIEPVAPNQFGVCFSGPGNPYGRETISLIVNWEPAPGTPEPTPTDILDVREITPVVAVRALTRSAPTGAQDFSAAFSNGADPQVYPGLQVIYQLSGDDEQEYPKTEPINIYPSSNIFKSQIPFTLGYSNIGEGNWQTNLFKDLQMNRKYLVSAYYVGEPIPPLPEDPPTDPPPDPLPNISLVGESDEFVIVELREFDTVPYIANFYGVPLDTILADNRPQDYLTFAENTYFLRNPTQNALEPFSRSGGIAGQELFDLYAMRLGYEAACAYGLEPINLNTGNFYFAATDAENTEYNGSFSLTRTYNSQDRKMYGGFGAGWSFEYSARLSGRQNGDIVYKRGDGQQLVFAYSNGRYIPPEGSGLSLSRAYDKTSPETAAYVITEEYGKTLRFNAFGMLTSITDNDGLITKMQYDSENLLTAITTGSGRKYSFSYNDSAQITAVALPGGGVLRYGYSGDLLTNYTNADGDTVRYVYDGAGHMTEWYDGNGARIIKNQFDSLGRVTVQTDSAGIVSTLSYFNDKTVVENNLGEVSEYYRDDLYRSVRVVSTDSKFEKSYSDGKISVSADETAGITAQYSYSADGSYTLRETRDDAAFRETKYNSLGRISGFRDFDGAETLYIYDSGDKYILKEVRADGSEIDYTRDAYGRVTSEKDGDGNLTLYQYTDLDKIVKTDPAGEKWEYYYDKIGHLITEIDPLEIVHRKTYTPAGRLETSLNAGDSFSQYGYDGAGNCDELIDPAGGKSTFTFDPRGNMLTARDPEGNTIKYAYDGKSRKISRTEPDGGVYQYFYDEQNLIKTIDPLGDERIFTYNDKNLLTSEIDENGTITLYSYDSISKLPETVTTPDGVLSYEYDLVGRLLAATDYDGAQTLYSYDPLGQVTLITQTDGVVTAYSYNHSGLVTQISDNVGRELHNRYDSRGNLIAAVDPMGRETIYEYDAANRLTRQTAPGGIVTELTYHSDGNIASLKDSMGGITLLDYDANGNLAAKTDPLGNITRYAYNPLNELSAQTDALGNTTTISYNAAQLPTKITFPMTEISVGYEYDKIGQITKMTDQNGNIYRLKYDNKGNNTEIVTPDGEVTLMEYDHAGRLTRSSQPGGLIKNFTYDNMGRLLEESDNCANIFTYEYDAGGRPAKITDAAGRNRTYSYDLARNLLETQDENLDSAAYTYDILSRVTSIRDNAGRITNLTYDEAGNIVTVTEAEGQQTQFELDKLGRILSEINPMGQATKYDYDMVGNLISTTFPDGEAEVYGYDSVYNLTALTDARGYSTSYAYDPLGRLKTVSSPAGNFMEYVYDNSGNVAQTRDVYGAVTKYSYDEMLRLREIISPNGGKTDYSYSEMGLVISEIDPAGAHTKYEYSPDGKQTAKTSPRGLRYSYTYDSVGRIAEITDTLGNISDIEYDRAGNITTITDAIGRALTYRYDIMHGITAAVAPTGAESRYTYDSRGNLTSEISPLGAETTYSYNILNDLVMLKQPLTEPIYYSYDSRRRVTALQQGEKRTTTKYDPVGNIVSQQSPMGAITQRSYTEDNRLAVLTDGLGSEYSVEYDLKGRIAAISDPLGNLEKYGYDAENALTRLTRRSGSVTRYSYDVAGRLTRTEDAEHRIAEYDYDLTGNVTSERVGGRERKYEYDIAGNLSRVQDPGGAVESFKYDKFSRLKEKIGADGRAIKYDYNALDGLLTKDYGQFMEPTNYAYTSAGLRTKMGDSLGETSYKYDVLGRLSEYKNSDDKAVKYRYDGYGRVSEIEYPNRERVRYAYDLDDRIVSVTDAHGGGVSYEYDAAGGVIRAVRGDVVSEYKRDELGRVVQLENSKNGKNISKYSYLYDPDGRIISETEEINGSERATEYEYSPAGELIRWVERQDGREREVSYSYDIAGNGVTKVKDGSHRSEILYVYDDVGRVTRRVSEGVGTDYKYDKNGNLIQKRTGKTSVTYTYDIENRLTAVHQDAALLMAATYDGDDNRMFQISRRYEDFSISEDSAQFKEDVAFQPERSESALPNSDWHSDTRFGNYALGIPNSPTRTEQKITASETNYTQSKYYYEKQYRNVNKYLFWRVALYTFVRNVMMWLNPWLAVPFAERAERWCEENLGGYDLVLKAREGSLYDNNEISALLQAGLSAAEVESVLGVMAQPLPAGNKNLGGASLPEGLHEKYADVPTAAEIQAQHAEMNMPIVIDDLPGALNRYEYDLSHYVNDINPLSHPNTEVLMEYGRRGEVKNSYTYGNERVSVQRVNGAVETYLYDGRGSVVQTLTRSGVKDSYRYDGYGIISGANQNDIIFGYNGEEYSPVTGLQYLRARYYAPEDGRFLSKDTYAGNVYDLLSLNRYIYAENDPVNRIDPTGHVAEYAQNAAKTAIENSYNSVCDILRSLGFSREDLKTEEVTRALAAWLFANPAAVYATQNGLFKEFFYAAGFFRDEKGIYHSHPDAIQQLGGYNDFYDIVFYYATSMGVGKFDFSMGDRDFVLWAWKGDYLNLGAGAELGIYSNKSGILGKIDITSPIDGHWLVDTNLAMPMTLTLKYKGEEIIDYNPSEKQWWVTGFNPYLQGVQADDLTAIYTVNFSANKDMFTAFKNSLDRDEKRWTFDNINYTATFTL